MSKPRAVSPTPAQESVAEFMQANPKTWSDSVKGLLGYPTEQQQQLDVLKKGLDTEKKKEERESALLRRAKDEASEAYKLERARENVEMERYNAIQEAAEASKAAAEAAKVARDIARYVDRKNLDFPNMITPGEVEEKKRKAILDARVAELFKSEPKYPYRPVGGKKHKTIKRTKRTKRTNKYNKGKKSHRHH